MQVYSQDKMQRLEEYDLNKGTLVKSTMLVHYPKINEIEEKGHYEIIRVNPNGGKDIKWIIDVKGVEGQEEHNELEDILVYVPYTEEQIKRIENEKLIENCIIRMEELTKDFIQVQAGLIIPNIEEKKKEFQKLLNDVRALQGKQPRDVKTD